MKLSKAQSKAHAQALDLVHSDRTLTEGEREFVLENYFEAQGQLNALAGAFFTPMGLARDFAIEVPQCRSIVDLCAGIGMLSFACECKAPEIVCVEACEAYVLVGRRVMPRATWIHADVFTADLGQFDVAISNPPFGRIAADAYKGPYTGGEFEYRAIELASRHARYGVFILPQMSAPFRYSGSRHYREEEAEKARKFREQTGIVMAPGCGIDTAMHVDDWHGVSPICEIVCCDFEPAPAEAAKTPAQSAVVVEPSGQLSLLDEPGASLELAA